MKKLFERKPKAFILARPEQEPIEIKAKSSGSEFRYPLPEFPIFACLEEIE